MKRGVFSALVLLTIAVGAVNLAAGDRALTLTDLMQMQQIRQVEIAEDGAWIAYALVPDRGDGEAVLRATGAAAEWRIANGSHPTISSNSRWAAAAIEPTLEEREQASSKKGQKGKKKGKDDKDKPKKGLSLVDLTSGDEVRIDQVESFAFSEDGLWLAYKHYREEQEEEEEQEEAEEPAQETETAAEEEQTEEQTEEEAEAEEAEIKEKMLGTTLVLRQLERGEETTIEHVTELAFSETEPLLAYVISAPAGTGNGVFVRRLGEPGEPLVLAATERGHYSNLSWAREQSRLAFTAAVLDQESEPGDAEVRVWDQENGSRCLATRAEAPEGWTVPAKNKLSWSRDGARLFFGFKPLSEEDDEDDEKESAVESTDETAETAEAAEGGPGEDEKPFDPYDLDALLEQRGVDVWHWDDPLIIPHQKERWQQEKDRIYLALADLDSGRVVALADPELPEVEPADNPFCTLARSGVPYQRELTWKGQFNDLYTVDLTSGKRHLVAERLASGFGSSLSPGGRYLVFYQEQSWHLHDVAQAETRNLTAGLGVPFANEDHDYPTLTPGYGQAEWLADDSGVLIYDKYDIWQVYTDQRPPLKLTSGREQELTFRVVDLDPEEDSLAPASQLLLTAYHNHDKHDAFYSARLGQAGVRPLYRTGKHRLRVVAKAKEADRILFTRERYEEFPDLYSAQLDLQQPQRLTDVNPGIADFAWGEAELVEWSSLDGIPLQGVLIKPGNYQPDRRYPVLVYYYRFFSQRLHQFSEPVVNHRPSFPFYASNGYAVFLPDIRFEIGRPGFSATKCLVPGVQKLIDMGIADPHAIGLHGHSWSGYQTAFVITQTNIFAAAVAGAPVSNMTSAYSGIRWGTGMARQFQYEMSQSRIGGSLWEYPERYIESSPVFFADRIETPLLIQFGDEDGAVPWYQGIELYLACRRLRKECIFLQYRAEPHHLKQYPNKLDYSIKMKQFFDHHLKGEPAPAWMTEGVPYTGD